MNSELFPIPLFNNYFVSKNGDVFSNKDNEFVQQVDSNGYRQVTLSGVTIGVHRLMGLTFHGIPENYEQLDVNHKDGNKSNNWWENLEWATRSENCIHAYKTGLRTDNTPILVRDLRTDEITRHYSLQDCARRFNCNGALIYQRLKKPGIFKRYYVLIRDGGSWPSFTKADIPVQQNKHQTVLIATSCETGETFIFDGYKNAGEIMKVNPETLYAHVKLRGDRPYNGYLFKIADDLKIVEEVEKSRKKSIFTPSPRKPIRIRVTNTRTNEVSEWESSEAFSKVLGIKKNTFQSYVLRHNGYWKEFRVEYLNDSPS
jgi:hypothetical protein